MSSTVGEGFQPYYEGKAAEYGKLPNNVGEAVMEWLRERAHSRQPCIKHAGH